MPQNRRSMENMLSLVNWWQIPLGYFLLFASYLGLRLCVLSVAKGLSEAATFIYSVLSALALPLLYMKASLPHWERDLSLSARHWNHPAWLRDMEWCSHNWRSETSESSNAFGSRRFLGCAQLQRFHEVFRVLWHRQTRGRAGADSSARWGVNMKILCWYHISKKLKRLRSLFFSKGWQNPYQ